MKSYLKDIKCVTEVPDVILRNAPENPLGALTPLLIPNKLGAAGDE
jgi:hypothetical protein